MLVFCAHCDVTDYRFKTAQGPGGMRRCDKDIAGISQVGGSVAMQVWAGEEFQSDIG